MYRTHPLSHKCTLSTPLYTCGPRWFINHHEASFGNKHQGQAACVRWGQPTKLYYNGVCMARYSDLAVAPDLSNILTA
ncbi:hypothetical protein DMENIID0001_060420 [Sergentomyia squamirostris]